MRGSDIEELERMIAKHGHDVTDIKLTYPMRAGAFIRGQVKREMQSFCWARGYELDIKEAKGWIESELIFRITVPVNEAVAVKRVLDAWMNQMNG